MLWESEPGIGRDYFQKYPFGPGLLLMKGADWIGDQFSSKAKFDPLEKWRRDPDW